MGITRQIWTLTEKNIRILLFRHWFWTTMRALVVPSIFMFFISYARNFFVPPSTYGIGEVHPIRDFIEAMHASAGGRNIVAFVNNGFTGGEIENLINYLSDVVNVAGLSAAIVSTDDDLLATCPSTLRGVSPCFAAASFHSSPSEGPYPYWNYTLRADGALEQECFVNRDDNDAEIYVLPIQHAIDASINILNGSSKFPSNVDEYIFTTEDPAQRKNEIRQYYMNVLDNVLAVGFFVGMLGLIYQLPGHMSGEREIGMSQLIEAMVPNQKRSTTQVARLIACHLAFDIIYIPGWIIMAAVLKALVFTKTDAGLLIGFHLLAGLSLCSMSIFGGSLFRISQLSGISVTVVAIILAIMPQVETPTSEATAALLGLFFPPMTYTLLILYMARFEYNGIPTNLTESAPDYKFAFPGIGFFCFFVVQIFVYPVFAIWTERILYGTGSEARRLLFNPRDKTHAIWLRNFSKHYKPNWWQRLMPKSMGGTSGETVVAVDNLSFSALRGQIYVLLGANGSGKSTTLDSIAGLNKITSGEIIVNGTGGLGLCPQKNVLWDELSVWEHVVLFNRLKSTLWTDDEFQIMDLIQRCDLENKVHAQAKTLSGGQKRKLQLAMMFTGGSRVCCIDEVSSGLDPLSRRKIWDILLRERGIRTLLVTTHFLDEADILSDHIAILSRGRLKAQGSAVELKSKLGDGYHVMINSLRERSVAGFQVGTYKLPDSATTSTFINQLEQNGIFDYEVSGPTIEDVFLSLSEEVKIELNETVVTSSHSGGGYSQFSEGNTIVQSPTTSTEMEEHRRSNRFSLGPTSTEDVLDLVKGEGTSVLRQATILFMKRMTVLRRNFMPYLAALFVPLVTAGLVMLFLKDFPGLGCNPGDQASNPNINTTALLESLDIPIGPPGAVSVQEIADLAGLNASIFHVVNNFDDFNEYVAANYQNVTPGGAYLGDAHTVPTIAYIGNWYIGWSVFTQNLIDNILGGIPIATQFQSFATPFAPSDGKTIQAIFYFGLAMCAYPAFFALYPTAERVRMVRALHYSNGIEVAPLWLAYLAFDFVFVLIISILVIVIFVTSTSIWHYPGYVFIVFAFYGLTSTLWSHLVSLFVSSQLAAFAMSAGVQGIMFLLYFIAYITIKTYRPPYEIDHDILIAHFTIALVTPSGNLLRALLLTFNEFNTLCVGEVVQPNPGAITAFGGPIAYLIIQGLILLALLIWCDGGFNPLFHLRNSRRRKEDDELYSGTPETDPTSLPQSPRSPRSPRSPNSPTFKSSMSGLRVEHLTKSFGDILAVDDITFSVAPSMVFALLGPNGAGKSTTISLIRGDLRPDPRGGDVFVEGISVNANRTAARKRLGVCPQFDAMDSMTVAEHLRFYGRARGVPDVRRNVEAVIEAVGLLPYRDRMAQTLSGGSKRKLSLGIALMGNPAVLLLDEPSSGMDAASKRVMWRTLEAVTRGRAMLITTHSMEEADRLAHRAGIMATRGLALDTVAGLRKRFGDDWHVDVVLRGAPHVPNKVAERVRAWIEENIAGSVFEDTRMWHGQLRFKVHRHVIGNSAASLFRQLEENRQMLRLEYYSVSQTTLDQVFLTIVGRHNIEEDMNRATSQQRRRSWKEWRRSALENA